MQILFLVYMKWKFMCLPRTNVRNARDGFHIPLPETDVTSMCRGLIKTGINHLF